MPVSGEYLEGSENTEEGKKTTVFLRNVAVFKETL